MRNDTTNSADEFFAKYYDVGTDLDNDDDDDYLDAVDYVLVRRTDLHNLAAAVHNYDATTDATSTTSRRRPQARRQLPRRRRHCRRRLASEPPPPSASPRCRRSAFSSRTVPATGRTDRHS